jgi:AcrR family transcriptional regulator
MILPMAQTIRPLRADAERNRRLLIDAAAEAFAQHGLDVSVGEIARRAGVGRGTLFRRFPTKEHLIAAIFVDRVSDMTDTARLLMEEEEAGDALGRFMRAMIEMQVKDRGLFEAVGHSALTDPDVLRAHDELLATLGKMVRSAQRAGEVRDDVGPIDILMLTKGVAAAAEPMQCVVPRSWERYLDLVTDGLRPAAATKLCGRPPSRAQFEKALRDAS